ncbi:MAG: HAD-IIA family hydrolase [Chloroflexi bacterium]|nr:HAD-IIA family hydrolase [Chloroflexota bacterium]
MSLSRLSPPPRALILDMDGVLWRADHPIGDLPGIFARIAERGLKVMLVTNNSTRTPAHYLEKLRRFGVTLQPWQVLNSSLAVAAMLHERFPDGGEVYAVGETGLLSALTEAGFTPLTGARTPDAPLAVVAGMDHAFDYEKIANAARLIRAGCPFYATNPDRTYPTPQGLQPGAGTVLAAIGAASGAEPVIAGKPQPYLFRLALERMGAAPEETLVVGDRLETDILGGQHAGCKTALVLSGVATREAAEAWRPPPDVIADDLETLLES